MKLSLNTENFFMYKNMAIQKFRNTNLSGFQIFLTEISIISHFSLYFYLSTLLFLKTFYGKIALNRMHNFLDIQDAESKKKRI